MPGGRERPVLGREQSTQDKAGEQPVRNKWSSWIGHASEARRQN